MLKIGHQDFRPYDISQFGVSDFNYFAVDISILCPSKNLSVFQNNITALHDLASDPEHIEILVKLDSDVATSKLYVAFLSTLKFKWKLLVYDKGNAYNDLHIFYDDLAKLSFGQTLWLFNDFLHMHTPQWDIAIRSSRNVFEDNIYVMQTKTCNHKHSRFSKLVSSPLISQEMYMRLGMIAPNRKYAEFLNSVGESVKRMLYKDEILVYKQEQHRDTSSSFPLEPYKDVSDDEIVLAVKSLNIL